MTKTSFTQRLKYALSEPNFSNVGIELNSDSIRLAVIEAEKDKITVQHLDAEPLPPGTVEITPFKPNINSIEIVAEALKRIWGRNRLKNSKVCVLLQDRAALTFNVTLEHAATSSAECLDLIRFKLKKNVPFRIEDTRISYFNVLGQPDHSDTNLWVTLISHPVLQQYEQMIQSSIDAECGLIDLNTFNLMNLAHARIKEEGLNESDLLYVNLNHDYISIAITQKSNLMFYRSRALTKEDGILEEALQEIHPATMFYVDKLGGSELARVFIYAVDNPAALHSSVQDRIGLPAEILSIDSFTANRFDSSNEALIQSFTPLVGLITSRRLEFQ
jgi:type IV pilus assembly protein PilM